MGRDLWGQITGGIGDVLKTIAPVAQFIPGIGQFAKYIPAAVGMLEGGKADRASQRNMGAAGDYYSKAAKRGGGIMDAWGGAMDPMIQQLLASIQNPTDTASPQYRAMMEGAGHESNNAMDQIMADYAARGLGNGGSGMASAIANARFGVAAGAHDAARKALLDQSQARNQMLLSGIGAMNSGLSTGANIGGIGAQGMGGLGGLWASRADQYAGTLGKMGALDRPGAPVPGATPPFAGPGLGKGLGTGEDWLNPGAARGPDAGSNTLGTNANPLGNPLAGTFKAGFNPGAGYKKPATRTRAGFFTV